MILHFAVKVAEIALAVVFIANFIYLFPLYIIDDGLQNLSILMKCIVSIDIRAQQFDVISDSQCCRIDT